jgi:GT2 family glycosyltransferase
MPLEPAMPDLAVLIVSWNVRELLRACLTSVYADLAASGIDAYVCTVDNASHDGSAEMVRAEFAQVHLVINQMNLGFAGGNNVGLRQLSVSDPPRYVLLLNPDTEVRRGALGALLDFMEARPRAAVAGPRLFFGDGSFQHSAFGFPGCWQILFDLYPLPGRLYESRLNGRYPRASYERRLPFQVDHPLGAAMMVRWSAIRQVGTLDESFHMYCEEIDWCMRMKRAGWQVYCVPQAQIVHHAGQSTRQIQEQSFVNLWRSRRQLYDKHYRAVRRFLAGLFVRLGMKRKRRSVRKALALGRLEPPEAEMLVRAYSGALAFFD